MSLRSRASATIAFGLVSLPVKLYSVIGTVDGPFNQMNPATGNRIKQKLVDAETGEEVDRKTLVKGIDVNGTMVAVSAEEIASIAAAKEDSIQIIEFVPVSSIDPLYFEGSSDFVAPGKGGARAYGLLHRALRDTGFAGIARFSPRGREQLVALRATAEGLVLQQLSFTDNVRSWDLVGMGPIPEPSEKEMKVAMLLIDGMKKPAFTYEYMDEYKKRLAVLVEAKSAGVPVEIKPPEKESETLDLMDALLASLGR